MSDVLDSSLSFPPSCESSRPTTPLKDFAAATNGSSPSAAHPPVRKHVADLRPYLDTPMAKTESATRLDYTDALKAERLHLELASVVVPHCVGLMPVNMFLDVLPRPRMETPDFTKAFDSVSKLAKKRA